MSNLIKDRIEIQQGLAKIRGTTAAVEEILSRLERGDTPEATRASLELNPIDLVAALAFAGLGDDDSLGPALTRESPSRPKLAGALSEQGLGTLAPTSRKPERTALAAGLLLINDFWESSHNAAQEAEDLGERSTSAYWHGIAHRREPDPGNASYWFRRVGRHPVLAELGESLSVALARPGEADGLPRLKPGSGFDPFAMIDLCSRVRPGTVEERGLRRVQRLEMVLLLNRTIPAVFPNVSR